MFVKELQKVKYSNYERYSFIDFLGKLMKFFDAFGSRYELKIFHSNGLIEKLLSWFMLAKKLLLMFQKSHLHIDEKFKKKLSLILKFKFKI